MRQAPTGCIHLEISLIHAVQWHLGETFSAQVSTLRVKAMLHIPVDLVLLFLACSLGLGLQNQRGMSLKAESSSHLNSLSMDTHYRAGSQVTSQRVQ